jgi:nitrogen fixation NifU-like protein
VVLKNHIIKIISFHGSGCAIFMASASIMTEATKGKSVQEARAISKCFRQIVGDSIESPQDGVEMGDLNAFSGVKGYPARMKCALLPWKTLLAALEDPSAVASRQSPAK